MQLPDLGLLDRERTAFREGMRSFSVTPLHTNLARCALFALSIGWGPAPLLHARAHLRAERACQRAQSTGRIACEWTANGDCHSRCPLCSAISHPSVRPSPANALCGFPEIERANDLRPTRAAPAAPLSSPSVRAPPALGGALPLSRFVHC